MGYKTKKNKVNKKKYSKRNAKKQRMSKRKYSKKYRGGGCGCSKLIGGSVDAPSFRDVPIHSFYPYNKYNEGTDVQGAQVSSRTLPNMNGGRRKMKGGGFAGSTIGLINDPMLGNNVNLINSFGNTSGSLLGNNILGQVSSNNYLSAPISNPTIQNPLV